MPRFYDTASRRATRGYSHLNGKNDHGPGPDPTGAGGYVKARDLSTTELPQAACDALLALDMNPVRIRSSSVPPRPDGLKVSAPAQACGDRFARRMLSWVGAGLLLLAGCAAVPVHEQRLVSEPNMQFSRSTITSYDSRVLSQLQPGRLTTGGAQVSTCTLCR